MNLSSDRSFSTKMPIPPYHVVFFLPAFQIWGDTKMPTTPFEAIIFLGHAGSGPRPTLVEHLFKTLGDY